MSQRMLKLCVASLLNILCFPDGDNDGDEGRVLATPFQAVAISSRNNLHCNDLSDYSTINAVDAPKEF